MNWKRRGDAKKTASKAGQEYQPQKPLFNMAYFKSAPTEYTFHTRDKKVLHEGKGIGFWCNTRADNVMLVPLSEWDDPFSLEHRCRDDQDVEIEGKVLYQIVKPKVFIEKFNYSVDPVTRQRYTSDSQRLVSRIIDLVSDSLRVRVRSIGLTDLLNEKADLGSTVKSDITERVGIWGVQCNGIYISKIAPSSKELADALEAPYREKMLFNGEREKLLKVEGLAREQHKNALTAQERERAELAERVKTAVAKRDYDLEVARTSAESEKLRLAVLEGVSDKVLFAEAIRRVNYLALTPDLYSQVFSKKGGSAGGIAV